MRFILSIIVLFSFQLTFSQLSVSLVDDGTPILDGDVFDFSRLGSQISSDGKLKFLLSNSSDTETINVLGQMVSYTNTNGEACQFCVQPDCFFAISEGQTIPNEPIVLAPGEDNGNFDSFYNSDPGDDENYPISYTFRFFMLDDEGNEVGDDITITYNYTPENFSTSNFSLEDLGITLQNTVVSESLVFNSNNKVSFTVYDINGRHVKRFNGNSGQHRISLADLSTGHYILRFEDDLARQVQVRIQKK